MISNIGLQLHTIRDEMVKDFRGTLKRVAEIGYTEVEFAGHFAQPVTAIKEMLGECGLTAPATHVSLDVLEDELQKSIDDALVLNHTYLVLSGLPPGTPSTIEEFRRRAEQFNNLGMKIGKAGLRFCYHNHAFEFESIDHTVPYEILLNETDPTLVTFELDVYWAVFAGQDPVALFAEHPNRFPLLHLKDMDGGPKRHSTEVGNGIINIDSILSHPLSGAEHFFVEQEHFSSSSMESAEVSFSNLRSLRSTSAPNAG